MHFLVCLVYMSGWFWLVVSSRLFECLVVVHIMFIDAVETCMALLFFFLSPFF